MEVASAAVAQVIATTELLEQILLGLDIKTLLLSQRVNRQFKAVIDGSTRLQKALFFQQGPPSDDINPLLANCFSIDNFRCYLYNGPARLYWRFDAISGKKFRDSIPEASWRRMYLKHGPLAEDGRKGNKTPRIGLTVWSNGLLVDRRYARIPRDTPLVMGEFEKIAVTRFRRYLPKLRLSDETQLLELIGPVHDECRGRGKCYEKIMKYGETQAQAQVAAY